MSSMKMVSERLADRAIDVAQYLYPQGQRCGQHWQVGSIQGERGKSLKICLQGDKRGRWADFATDHRGDLIDLWCARWNISPAEALKEARDWLGIREIKFMGYRPPKLIKPAENFATLNSDSNVSHYLQQIRKLSWQTLQAFKIAEKADYIVFPYYHEQSLLMSKYLHIKRENEKKKMFVEKNSVPCLFGWQALPENSREVSLTEGEIDAMSLAEYGIPALSLPLGGGAGDKHRWIDQEFDRLAVFEKIYLCFDQDEAGQQAVNAVIERLGRYRCYVVELPEKDANACLQKGLSQSTIEACFERAKTQDPAELKSAQEYVDQVMNLFYPHDQAMQGYYSPWSKTKAHMCFRPHELSVWTGINGHGKSQFLGQLLLQFMQQGARVCIASLEMKPERLLMRMTRQLLAQEQPDQNKIAQAHEWYANKLWLFDLVGTAKTERLLEVFLYARQRYGVDVFLLDSLLKCHIADDDYNTQKAFIEQLCDFKNEHPCHVHVVVHPRKGADENIIPGKLDIKGTGSISDLADNCFTVWRNKLHAQPTDADCIWDCHKQRNGEWEGKFEFWFDQKCFQYRDSPKAKSQPIIQFASELGTELV